MKMRGFSLVELLLVVGLLILLAVAAFPKIFAPDSGDLLVVANKIKSDIEHARGLATTVKGTTFGVFFDDSAESYIVYAGIIATPASDPLTKTDMIETFSKWPSISITGGNFHVTFDSLGAATIVTGSDVTITNGALTKTITVIESTGKVTIQ